MKGRDPVRVPNSGVFIEEPNYPDDTFSFEFGETRSTAMKFICQVARKK
ncbi:hypothetical protein KHA80_11330 [Anaerobacillus sp. HL2]|nr:hypothetical protein KHA80_11330 [Anaerobacillus sp. HL2]